MRKERFSVQWSLEGDVEVLLPPDATEQQINDAARTELENEFRGGRGALPADINIGQYIRSPIRAGRAGR